MMNILILGSGGREHAFAWKISQSQLCNKLFVAPGNAGTQQIAKNININNTDFAQVKSTVLEHNIDLVLVGPEAPLVNGIVDFFRSDTVLKEVLIVGPTKAGAILEGSKIFSKTFMQSYGIPTAGANIFSNKEIEEAVKFVEQYDDSRLPVVIKADGLAAGKGVIISSDIEEAQDAVKEMLSGQFGEASEKILIEECLKGVELSVFVLTDGKDYKILPNAKDYKRIGEGDTGLNTGGMGAISPVPFADDAFMQKVEDRVVKPTIKGLQEREIDFRGFLFIGLMNVNGDPFVIEYNVRMGDPETQVVLPRIDSDILPLLKATADQTLSTQAFEISPKHAATVVLVSGGYPEQYEKGKEIIGLEEDTENMVIFHAGTKKENNTTLTNGGRVLAITALKDKGIDAKDAALLRAESIDFEGKYYRRDIGMDIL